MVFVEDTHPREHLTAKTTRPNCASVEEVRVVTADIRNHIEQALRMEYPKRLNASTDCAALARTFHGVRTPPDAGERREPAAADIRIYR